MYYQVLSGITMYQVSGIIGIIRQENTYQLLSQLYGKIQITYRVFFFDWSHPKSLCLIGIVGKKRDHGILAPMIFSGKIRKNRINSEKYCVGEVFQKNWKNTKKSWKNTKKFRKIRRKKIRKIQKNIARIANAVQCHS